MSNIGPEDIAQVIGALLSWLFLAAIAIIISGKLISLRLPLGLQDESEFVIPLVVFHIRAKGEEVITGFSSFIFSLAFTIFVGGEEAYNLFKSRAGIDIGHWNSLCAIAGFISLVVALSICIFAPIIRTRPIINKKDRSDILDLLEKER